MITLKLKKIFTLELKASNKNSLQYRRANIAYIEVENIYRKSYCSIFSLM